MTTMDKQDTRPVLECQACNNRVEFSVSAVEHKTWHVDKHGEFEEAAGACEDSTKGDDYTCRHCDSEDVKWVEVCKGCECMAEFCLCTPSTRRYDFTRLTNVADGIAYEVWWEQPEAADGAPCNVVLRPAADTTMFDIVKAMETIRNGLAVIRFTIDRVPNDWYNRPREITGAD